MKIIIFLAVIALGSIALNAQTRPTTAADYDGTVQYAVSETNRAFPFVFTVVSETFEGGKLVVSEKQVSERQAMAVQRETKILRKGQQTLHSYSVMIGFDNGTYCSTDGVKWLGPQQHVCPGPEDSYVVITSGLKRPESVEYWVTDKTLDGKTVKVYRKYAIFAPKRPNGKKSFEEEIATIDSRGFCVSVVDTEGTLDPTDITFIRKQTWDFETKFKPVVAPKEIEFKPVVTPK
jgi:hypothetical protein